MKSSYFIYSERREDEDYLRRLKVWLPPDIDIIEAKITIKKGKLVNPNFGGLLDDDPPSFLVDAEKPAYVTFDAYRLLSNSKNPSTSFSEVRRLERLVVDLSNRRELVCGKDEFEIFIEYLRKS